MSTSTAERLIALEHANDIRLARADLRHRIFAGEVFAASVILDPPPEAETWEIGDLLVCQRRWGDIRMRNFLSRLGIRETIELAGPVYPVGRNRCGHRGLTDRQRERIVEALGTESGYREAGR